MCGSMTWWYVTSRERYSSHLPMLILFEHSPQRGLRKGIYLLIFLAHYWQVMLHLSYFKLYFYRPGQKIKLYFYRQN